MISSRSIPISFSGGGSSGFGNSHDLQLIAHPSRGTVLRRQLDGLSLEGRYRNVLFTDGAKYVADQGGAYWLLDEIALAQRGQPRVAAEEFQVWRLSVKPDRTATLT